MIEYYEDAPREVGLLIRKYCTKSKRHIPPKNPYAMVLRRFFDAWADFQFRGTGIVLDMADGRTIRAKNPTDLRKKLEGSL